MALPVAQCRRLTIDSHLHVWSTGDAPYPLLQRPPPELATAATYQQLRDAARAAAVDGAVIVQPANHGFDHSYVSSALKAEPAFFRGCLLADPTLPPREAVRELERLHADGFVAARFNPALFPEGMDSPVGHALFERAGELGMPVGVMTFGGLVPQLPAIRALIAKSPQTKLIIDHFGFFRQPATGGLVGGAAENSEEAWTALLGLAASKQVYVKVSALFRVSAELPPFLDLQPRLADLLRAFGPSRLMWGSDFPFVTIGGNSPTPCAVDYKQAAETLSYWSVDGLDEGARARLMGGTAAELFGFGTRVSG